MIDDPRIVKFSNERLRQLANLYLRAVRFGEQVLEEYRAYGGEKFLPPKDERIDDHSDADGRPPVTGESLTRLLGLAETVSKQARDNDNAFLNTLLSVAPNPEG